MLSLIMEREDLIVTTQDKIKASIFFYAYWSSREGETLEYSRGV